MTQKLEASVSFKESCSYGFIPTEPVPSVNEAYQAIHAAGENACGRTVTVRLQALRGGSGCGWCRGHQKLSDDLHAEILTYGFKPVERAMSANAPVRAVHDGPGGCAREVMIDLNHLRIGRRCGWCAGKQRTNADRAEELVSLGFHPLEEVPFAGVRVKAVHAGVDGSGCQREVMVQLDQLRKRRPGLGCGWCSGHQRTPEDLAEEMRSYGFDPREPVTKPNAPVDAVHVGEGGCGRLVRAQLSTLRMRTGGVGCGWCRGLQKTDDDRAKDLLDAGWIALEPVTSTRKKIRMRCVDCGQERYTLSNAVTPGQDTGAARCARSRRRRWRDGCSH